MSATKLVEKDGSMSLEACTNHDVDYRVLVHEALRDTRLVRITLSQKRAGDPAPWTKISVRPVLLRGSRHFQFCYFDGRKEIVKNASAQEAGQHLDEILILSFRQIHLQLTSGDTHLRITRRGKVLIGRGKPSGPDQVPCLRHDRPRPHPTVRECPDSFLQAIGILKRESDGKTVMEDKFHQVYAFLRVVLQTVLPNYQGARPIQIVDCGCGSSYLSFALYHYLNQVCNVPAAVVGIDRDADAIERCLRLRGALGWSGPDFQVSRITAFTPAVAPDVVVGLHACDTATDEAIAQGILWGSSAILVAPCCQHELHQQLRDAPLRPVLRHGVFKERLASLLTDALRAQVLRVMGYRARVVEFVALEHTAKNVMIQAEHGSEMGSTTAIEEYQRLRAFWTATPAIEQLLGNRLRQFLSNAKAAEKM